MRRHHHHHHQQHNNSYNNGSSNNNDLDDVIESEIDDAVNRIASSSATGGYYESFTLSSPPPTTTSSRLRHNNNHHHHHQSSSSPVGNGGGGGSGGNSMMDLHHRSVTSRRQHHQHSPSPVTPYHHHRRHQDGHFYSHNHDDYENDDGGGGGGGGSEMMIDDESPRHKMMRQLPSLGGASAAAVAAAASSSSSSSSSSPTGSGRRSRSFFPSWFTKPVYMTSSSTGRKKLRSSDYFDPTSSLSQSHSSSSSTFPSYRWVRYVVAVGIFMYVGTLYRSTYRLAGNSNDDYSVYKQQQQQYPFDYYWASGNGGGGGGGGRSRSSGNFGNSAGGSSGSGSINSIDYYPATVDTATAGLGRDGGRGGGASDVVRQQRHLFDPKWKQQRSDQLHDVASKTANMMDDRRRRSQPTTTTSSTLNIPSKSAVGISTTTFSTSASSIWYQYVPMDYSGRRFFNVDETNDHYNLMMQSSDQNYSSSKGNNTSLNIGENEELRQEDAADKLNDQSTKLSDSDSTKHNGRWNEQEEEPFVVATVDQLCGFTAQNASLSRPSSYPSRSALNSKSRVLITGILNPVGLSLALHLHQKCGVQVVTGVDTMFPNTVMNRMLLQERMQLLLTSIPKFVRPVILPFVGLDPRGHSDIGKTSSGKDDNEDVVVDDDDEQQTQQQRLQYLQDFEPTHIVHLATYSYDVYSAAMIDPDWVNAHSPYVSSLVSGSGDSNNFGEKTRDDVLDNDSFLFPIRSSIISMQQLLLNVISSGSGQDLQFVYASSTEPSIDGHDGRSMTYQTVEMTMKRMEEVLVDAYHQHKHRYHGRPYNKHSAFSAIGLRLPNTIYGAWGTAGSIVHDMMERAVENWNLTYTTVITEGANVTTINTGSRVEGNILPPYRIDGETPTGSKLDLLYVDDAVNSIVAAMQYHSKEPISITVPAERSSSINEVASLIESYLGSSYSSQQNVSFDAGSHQVGIHASEILPNDRILLHEGLVRSLAWHIDRQSPYGPPKVETGDKFLRRHEIDTCNSDDLTCHKSSTFMPCSSECNVHEQCLSSIFDPVKELVRNVSDGCDIILYTQSLGYNVKDMDLHAEYMDDKDLDDDELLVCNFAFIPRESSLVEKVSNKVPNDQLAKFGIKPQQGDVDSHAMRERKLDGLNGRLLYRGWILIWVKDGVEPLTTADMSVLKMSPSHFFHPGVHFALFVEENFSVSPNLDDVLFLVDEMKRRPLPQRTLKKEEKVETPHGVVTKKVKLRLPEEPRRRAAILFAPLRLPNIDDPSIKQYRSGKRKLSIYDAAKFMRFEVGYEHKEKESISNRRQREYYERIPSYINKNTELRSNFEPWYRYSMRHWVRTRWVLHDFHLEEARQLRCDWYQEHLQWGNDLDQLSFANVMAIRELRRRIGHREPDDHVKSFIEEHPELHDLTDSYEWHDLETDLNKLHQEPTNWKSQLPGNLEQNHVDSTPEEVDTNTDSDAAPLYVRIMSERVMATSRKLWSKKKKLIEAKKAGQQE